MQNEPTSHVKLPEDYRVELTNTLFESRILVVEDDDIARIMIEGFLEAAGFSNFRFAEDGLLGLEAVETFEPELVVLDIGMPRMNGYEVLQRLRANPKHGDLPVIVETAFDAAEERNKAFDYGATDLVAKPLNGTELIARIRIHLENRLFTKQLQAYQSRLTEDLALARRMQSELPPPRSYLDHIGEKYGLQIASVFEPSSELGGDFWGMQIIGPGLIGFINADFTGHGVSAALNTFRLHSFTSNLGSEHLPPAEYLKRLNDMLHRVLPRGQYATAVCGHIDVEKGELAYAAAGAPPPFIRLPGEQEFTPLDSSGMPLGISQNASYTLHTHPFPVGAEYFFCSDALMESPNESGEMLGDEGVRTLLSKAQGQGGGLPLEDLLARFRAHAVQPIDDDLTAVWVKR